MTGFTPSLSFCCCLWYILLQNAATTTEKSQPVLIAGFLLLLIGWLAGHFWLGLLFESITTLAGSILLIVGHWMNYRHHRSCTNHRHDHHPVATEEN
jgi:hypothetical protein